MRGSNTLELEVAFGNVAGMWDAPYTPWHRFHLERRLLERSHYQDRQKNRQGQAENKQETTHGLDAGISGPGTPYNSSQWPGIAESANKTYPWVCMASR